jgi:hypothetical protein
MRKHRLFGIESNPLIWSERSYAGSVYTLGAPIWPRTAALFAAPGRFARLPHATQQLLRDAAARAADESDRALATADAGAVRQICRLGGRVAVLDEGQRDAMVRAGAGARDELPAELAPADLVARIVALKGDSGPQAPPPVPDGCGPRAQRAGDGSAADPAQVEALRKALRPGATYRSRVDYDVFKKLLGERSARLNAGTYTWQFLAHNRVSLEQKPQFADALHAGCLKYDGPYTRVGVKIGITTECDGDVIHDEARCSVRKGAIYCRITFDDGGYPADRRLGLEGMTEPLVPVHK